MASRKIEVEIIGDASSLERAFGRGKKSASGFERGLKSATIGAAGALTALGLAAKIGFDEFTSSQNVIAQTNAAITSTGGAAHVTAQQVGELSAALLHKTGIDDEVIQSGQNILLTFKNLRNEAGAGNDIFNQTSVAMLDLATAMHTGPEQAALQLGKALNDPARGMSRLQRVGVTFTDQQKDMVKQLVETGDTLGAQKIILGELTSEFGGSATAAGKTFTGQMGIAKEEAKNFTAELVAGAMPALGALSRALSNATEFMSEHKEATKIIIGVIAGLSIGLLAVRAAMVVWTAATTLATAAQWLLNVALTANPIGLVILALVALGVALVVAYKKSETFRNIVNAVWASVREQAETAWAVISAVIHAAGAVISATVGGLVSDFNTVVGILRAVEGAAQSAADAIARVAGAKSALGSVPGRAAGAGKKAAGFLGGLLPGRAAGGPVSAGRAYWVGERGPELFAPDVNGTVIPVGGGRGGDTYVFNFPNLLGGRREVEQWVTSAVVKANRRGSLLASDLT